MFEIRSAAIMLCYFGISYGTPEADYVYYSVDSRETVKTPIKVNGENLSWIISDARDRFTRDIAMFSNE